jgi:mannose-1-phosphate guanylyltransferase
MLAFDLASKHDYLVTLGITPTRPDTGYGYIQFVERKLRIFQSKNIY